MSLIAPLAKRLRAFAARIGDAHVLAVMRVAFGVMLFWEALLLAQELETRGFFGDVFHLSFLPDAWLPSARVYALLLAARLLLAALVTVGQLARPALAVSALLGIHGLLCDRLAFHHNRYTLFLDAFLLALTPCDRALTLGAPADAGHAGPIWARSLLQVQVAIVYLASGGSKLLDPDWRNGLVLGDRFARYGYQALARGIPHAVVDLFSRPEATSALAKLAIATELFLAFGLFARRTRIVALWWGVMFHLTIEVTSQVELFTWLTLTTYGAFATPDVHARTLTYDASRPGAAAVAAVARYLDWFARFEIRPWTPDALRGGHGLVVVRRDGTRATGIRAAAMLARTLPLLFPLWAPLALAASFTRGGDAGSRT